MIGEAWAQTPAGPPSGGGGGLIASLIPFILIFVIFYFLLILPQQRRQKKHKSLLEALKKGDKVVTNAGLLGTIANLNKEIVTLQVSDNVKIKVLRESIAGPRGDSDE
jgi:preprotein translocase subunit YajC